MKEIEFEKEKYEEVFERAFDEKHAEFESISKQKLIISLIGSVNAGKSQTINSLTGIKYTEVKARAGWTKDISLYELKKGVFIADTPGLYDIDEKVSQKATEFVEKDTDIVLFFLNASVGVTKHEKEAYEKVNALGKETIVVLNKIDSLDEDEIKDVLEQIKEELHAEAIPISAKKDIGIEKLNERIVLILEEKGKELLFLKVSRYKDKAVASWINGASVSAASIGAVPIPGVDIIPLTALQVGLAMRIAYIYDITPTKTDVMQIVSSTVTGSVGKQIFKYSITALKAAGWIPGTQPFLVATSAIAATIAGSITYGFGWACNAYYKSGMTMDLGEVGEVFDSFSNEYKKQKSH